MSAASVSRRDESDLGKLIEWVLNIAEARRRAWLEGEPDRHGFPIPGESVALRSSRGPEGSSEPRLRPASS